MAEFGFTQRFLNSVPELKKLVKRATDEGYEMDKFLDKLKNTKWWRTRTDAQRRFDVMRAENPKEVAVSVQKAKAAVMRMAAQMGVRLSSTRAGQIAFTYTRNDQDEGWLRAVVGGAYRGPAGSGQATVVRSNLQEMAGSYGVKVGNAALNQMTRNVLMGQRDSEHFEEFFRAQAERAFPSIKNLLDQGQTVRQILDPYIQIAAEEAGVNPASVDITNSMWQQPVQFRPPGSTGASAAPRVATFDEWTSIIRTDKRFGFDRSQNGQRAASVLSNQLMQAFGAMG